MVIGSWNPPEEKQTWKNPFQLPVFYNWNVEYLLFTQRVPVPTCGRGDEFPGAVISIICLFNHKSDSVWTEVQAHKPRTLIPTLVYRQSLPLRIVTPLCTSRIQSSISLKRSNKAHLLKSMWALAQDKAAIALRSRRFLASFELMIT